MLSNIVECFTVKVNCDLMFVTFLVYFMISCILYICDVYCRFVTFVFGAVLFVLVVLTWYDEDVLQIQHMITLMGGIGMVLSISTMLIPPEVSNLELVVGVTLIVM